MRRLRHRERVKVYHEVDDEGNHLYWFSDGAKRIDLDWGEIGHIPNSDDLFPYPEREIDLRLDYVSWADDGP
jgi:hypothetical protein